MVQIFTRYFALVNATEYAVFSHDNFIKPPPDGFWETVIVNSSTGVSNVALVKSTFAKS